MGLVVCGAHAPSKSVAWKCDIHVGKHGPAADPDASSTVIKRFCHTSFAKIPWVSYMVNDQMVSSITSSVKIPKIHLAPKTL
eukprot:jgi/Botrbrau1/3920/Bobra.0183s0141.1